MTCHFEKSVVSHLLAVLWFGKECDAIERMTCFDKNWKKKRRSQHRPKSKIIPTKPTIKSEISVYEMYMDIIMTYPHAENLNISLSGNLADISLCG